MAEKSCNVRPRDGNKNSPNFFVPYRSSMCQPFVTRQTSNRESISALTRCSRSPSMSEFAAMFLLPSSGRSCGTGVRKTESLTYPHKKNRVALDHSILVASEAASGLLPSFVGSCVEANADGSSRGRGCGNVAEPPLAGK